MHFTKSAMSVITIHVLKNAEHDIPTLMYSHAKKEMHVLLLNAFLNTEK